MTLRTTLPSAVGITLALGLAAGLAACAPAQEPADPTPTFSSEAEAFAAAEATYREYVKALNAVDLSDPETFEDVYAWTTGDANAGERETLSQMHADGWVVSGQTVVALVEPLASTNDAVAIAVCLDVADVTVVDDDGQSVISGDRPDIQSMRIELFPDSSSPSGLLISAIDGRDGAPQCAA